MSHLLQQDPYVFGVASHSYPRTVFEKFSARRTSQTPLFWVSGSKCTVHGLRKSPSRPFQTTVTPPYTMRKEVVHVGDNLQLPLGVDVEPKLELGHLPDNVCCFNSGAFRVPWTALRSRPSRPVPPRSSFWQFYMRATLAYRKAQLTSSVIDVATRLTTSLAKVNGGNDANISSLVSPFRQFWGDGATSHFVSFQGFAHRVRIISRDDVLDSSPSRIVELQLRVQLQARVLTKVVLKIVRVEVPVTTHLHLLM